MRLLLLLAVLAAALIPATAASAAPIIGISESNPMMFEDPSFKAMRISTTRLLIPYDVVPASARGDLELTGRVDPHLEGALREGVQPLVSFEHSKGVWEQCREDPRLPQCLLPSLAEYRDSVRAFLVRYPQVNVISPWNEANHPAQPTSKNPRMAAEYANAVDGICRELRRKCTIVVADVLDAADRAAAKRLTYVRTTRWIQAFRSALRIPRSVCGLHNYSDVNRFRPDGTRALMRALGCREYWITESGGVFRFGAFWKTATKRAGKCASAAACQLKATEYLFASTRRITRIKRIYVHSWYSGDRQHFDAGLVRGVRSDWLAQPRPAFYVVRDHARSGPSVPASELAPRPAAAPAPEEAPLAPQFEPFEEPPAEDPPAEAPPAAP